MQEIIRKAEELALQEIGLYDLPTLFNYETSNQKGVELAKQFNANIDIVQIGTRLMDVKLGEAFSKKQLKEHVRMSAETSKQFLSQFNLSSEVKDKIINCVEGHHGTTKWTCKEAEICANADCYRFLLVKNWLLFLISLEDRKTPFEENLKMAEEKADEKWKILSLDICKKELESQYHLIKEIVKTSKQHNL